MPQSFALSKKDSVRVRAPIGLCLTPRLWDDKILLASVHTSLHLPACDNWHSPGVTDAFQTGS